MRKIVFIAVIVLVALSVFRLDISSLSAYFAKFLVSTSTVSVALPSLGSYSVPFELSIDTSFAHYSRGEAPYLIDRWPECLEYNDDWECISEAPDLCRYISIEPGETEESTEVGFPLEPTRSSLRQARGELNLPIDEADEWIMAITSPCFESECPADYDLVRNGEPLPQEMKGETFICNVDIDAKDIPPLVRGNVAFAQTSADEPIKVSAVFTGEYEEKKLDPVIIVPGLLGSALRDGEWEIDPIFKTYDDLIDTFLANGYELNLTLFAFPYDWRESNVATAELLDEKIEDVKEVCECDKVDIVAHSMGGIATRQYVQSDEYDGDVDQMVFLGTPHKGAPKAYLTWEAGESDTTFSDQSLKLLLRYLGIKEGYLNLKSYIQEKVLSIGQLLPIYPYLIDSSTEAERLYPDEYPENIFLETVDSKKTRLAEDKILNIFSNISGSTIDAIKVGSTTERWEHGIPIEFGESAEWRVVGDGDGTVPAESVDIFSNSFVSSASHLDLPSEESVQIFKYLTGKDPSTVIKRGLISRWMFTFVYSPVDVLIEAPDGSRIGTDPDTGDVVNEIDGAFYSGNSTDIEYFAIPEPTDGKYEIMAKGTDEGGEYRISMSYVEDSRSGTADMVGMAVPDAIVSHEVNLEKAAEDPVASAVDTVLPVVSILSPIEGDYLRSGSVLISATSSDSGSGIQSLKVFFRGIEKTNGDSLDLFFEKLGDAAMFVEAVDGSGNRSEASVDIRVIATASSTISDIKRAYDLAWIKDGRTRDELVKRVDGLVKIQKVIETIEERQPNGKKTKKRIERFEEKVNRILAFALVTELGVYKRKGKIDDKAYNLIKEDLNWIIKNN